jgi:RNA 3'-phosphate cyclase
MGLQATINVHKYGYYPKGNGEVAATIERADQLKAIQLRDFGSIKTIKGVSVCTFLAERKVAERQAEAARLYLSKRGYAAEIQIVNDESNPLQRGSSLLLWAETDTGALIGADAIGEIKKPSEKVGEEAARKLHEEITAKPTVDIHLADLLIPYIALAEGKSVFLTRTMSGHLETNAWLAEEILKIKFNIERTNKLFKVQRMV